MIPDIKLQQVSRFAASCRDLTLMVAGDIRITCLTPYSTISLIEPGSSDASSSMDVTVSAVAAVSWMSAAMAVSRARKTAARARSRVSWCSHRLAEARAKRPQELRW